MTERWCKRCQKFVEDPYHRHVDFIDIIIFVLLILGFIFVIATSARAEVTEASYYTVASCLKEGTSGIMANGRRLNNETSTCASWDYGFGTTLQVLNKALFV